MLEINTGINLGGMEEKCGDPVILDRLMGIKETDLNVFCTT